MQTRVDERLRGEAQRFALRFGCEDCAHADRSGPRIACTFGYPPAPRRDALDGATLSFCKTFELGG